MRLRRWVGRGPQQRRRPGERAGADGRCRAAPASRFLASRVDEDGDLARLLDGTDPESFDKDHDGRLDNSELRRAFYAALDLDDDGELSRGELSRYPGELRDLRFLGPRAGKLYTQFDGNGDGAVSLREFSVAPAEVDALDTNKDGYVQLDVQQDPEQERRGILVPPREWPVRQSERYPLPPVVTPESVLAAFDRDRDGELSRREMRRRYDLWLELDRDGDARVDAGELALVLDRVARFGVEVTADGFLERWDLDGDGEVSEDELDLTLALHRRLGIER